MTKPEKIRLCDWMLVVTTLLILASSIQSEATSGRSLPWVWIHIILGCCFFANIIWHVYLHFGWKSWIQKFVNQKSRVTKWLAVLGLLTLISGIIVFFHWTESYTHSSIGGFHGKIGFIFLALAIWHTLKRIRFFKSARRK